ncbi:MAG: hypothetical protein QMD09_05600, partial [Desulfatibacillaceae bacterium]|nr:hypothetical protein [Desulfatibacillaceae bacterium]
ITRLFHALLFGIFGAGLAKAASFYYSGAGSPDMSYIYASAGVMAMVGLVFGYSFFQTFKALVRLR